MNSFKLVSVELVFVLSVMGAGKAVAEEEYRYIVDPGNATYEVSTLHSTETDVVLSGCNGDVSALGALEARFFTTLRSIGISLKSTAAKGLYFFIR